MRELEALRERERQRAEDDATRREEEDRRRGIWSCLPCLIPCFARRKDAFDVEKSAHSNPAHHQHKTGSQARGNPNHIYLFGDCDSDAHLQRGWGDGVSGGKTITIQSSMAYPDDEGEDSDGAHLPGARCEMRDARCESKRVNNPRVRDILNFIHSFCRLSLFNAVFSALRSRLTFLLHVQISQFQARKRRPLPQYHPFCTELVTP
jgi:hypothetical protein